MLGLECAGSSQHRVSNIYPNRCSEGLLILHIFILDDQRMKPEPSSFAPSLGSHEKMEPNIVEPPIKLAPSKDPLSRHKAIDCR